MKEGVRGWLAAGALALGAAHLAVAQEPAPPDSAATSQALRVFLDCQSRYCDTEFFQNEVPFVNYTRFRETAQVHLLMTSQQAGGGGFVFTLDFIGLEEFEELDDQLEVSTRANLSEEQVLTELSQAISLGLMRYVVRTPAADRVGITFRELESGDRSVATEEDDPWNFWVFRPRVNGNYFAESRQEFISVSGGFSANRITEDIKIQMSLSGSYRESNFKIDSLNTVTSINRNYDVFATSVWSLSEHWSIGGALGATHSTFSNQKLTVRAAPAIEYNFFPYSASTRRLLRVNYSMGLSRFTWIEETVFLETAETRPDARLTTELDVKQPWGQAEVALEFVVWLDDPSQNRLVLFGGLDLRLFRGLSLNLFGSAQRVRDQFNLPAGEATEEEILLRQRELATGFRYRLSVGFSYTFGSIFSNVVNPRFGGSGFDLLRVF